MLYQLMRLQCSIINKVLAAFKLIKKNMKMESPALNN